VKEVSDKIWLVTFMHYDLGFFDHETGRLENVDNPFAVKGVTHVLGINRYPCDRNRPGSLGWARLDSNQRPKDYEADAQLGKVF
jgi:hypothetical protein